MSQKDFYETLGVKKDASDAEIKSAYRKLAREWHPDVANGKPDAEKKFKEINEAYQILGNKEKRSQYDRFGHSAFSGGSQGGPHGDPFSGFGGGNGPFQWSYSTTGGSGGQGFEDPFDVFEQVFGFRGFGGERKGRSLQYTLVIDFLDAVKGFEDTVKVDSKKLKVKLPPGVRDGTQIKFVGHGENPGNGRPPGDLFLVVNIKPHPEFIRQGMDIISQKEISIAQASLGAKVPVKVVDPLNSIGTSEIKVNIPSGTQPESQIRLRGYGMPNPNGFGRGDHYLVIKVSIPKRLNKQQKKALEELF